MTKHEAERSAKELLAKMRNPGWEARVWENLGWHYSVDANPAPNTHISVFACSIHPLRKGERFFALFGDLPSAGISAWTTHGKLYRDPNAAARAEIRSARRHVDRELAMVESAEALLRAKGVLEAG